MGNFAENLNLGNRVRPPPCYGVIKKYLCYERVVQAHNIVITTPLKKRYSRHLGMLW